jgi:elongation factor P
MLSYNEITPGRFITLENEPYAVLTSHVSRKQQNKANNQVKLKSLLNGRVVEKTFHQSESVEEAEIGKQSVTYIYESRGEFWFHEAGNPKNRFTLSAEILGAQAKFLKANTDVDALVFDEKVIGILIPIKIDLAVKEAPPAVRGNTAQGATKQVTLETGATVTTPLFINTGDIVRVNTETGEYVERVTKA